MHEVLEEHAHHHDEEPWTLPVAITISILAVLVAMATLMGHRSSIEVVLLQTQASDQWAYYQAKNIRLHEMQSVADLMGVLDRGEKEKPRLCARNIKPKSNATKKTKTRSARRPRNWKMSAPSYPARKTAL